ncbi:MAG TPA: helix-turn-helix domain-containing protein [Pirellulales bacterium]|jgi:predicted DNA-binding transcriptional regulator AlpA
MSNETEAIRQLDAIESRILKLRDEIRKAECERDLLFRRVFLSHAATENRPASEPSKLLLTGDEAAAALSVCRKTLWRLTQPRGPIPVVSIGERGNRYSRQAIEKWIDQCETENR